MTETDRGQKRRFSNLSHVYLVGLASNLTVETEYWRVIECFVKRNGATDLDSFLER